MQKSDRQKEILNIISSGTVARQDELADLLRERGFEVTQASVSRDLDGLGVVKINGVYARPLVGTGRNLFGKVTIVAAGDALIVAKCASGLASAAAVRIDAASIPEIAGTIAGDDTIFVAVGDASQQKHVIKALRRLFGGEQKGEFS